MFHDIAPLDDTGLTILPPKSFRNAIDEAEQMARTAFALAMDNPYDSGLMGISMSGYAIFSHATMMAKYPSGLKNRDFYAFNMLRMLAVHRHLVERARLADMEHIAAQRLANEKLKLYFCHVISQLGEDPAKLVEVPQ